MYKLHLFLLILIVITSFLVFLSENPVHSVVFLILTFCNASSLLILFNVDFLSILYIIIYVGAIAVLFLFVVMMLNVKFSSFSYFLSILIITLSLLALQVAYGFTQTFLDLEYYLTNTENLFLVDTFSNIEIFGQFLYNYYIICFLLGGILLLIAMVGAIVLTLKFSNIQKTEFVFKQLCRSNAIVLFN